ncbi:MAG: FGGY family carbohydrate kinase [Bacteroidota bacterium]
MADYYIGLDLGTTAVKACAFATDGTLLGMEEREYPLLHPEPGAAVQNPDELLRAAEDALATLLRETDGICKGVGLSCPMHSLLLLDADKQPISQLYTWADVRPQAVLDQFSEKERLDLLARTGTPVHPMSPLLKLHWLGATGAAYAADLKSYLVHRWTTNGLLLDEQLASATGMMDLTTRQWIPVLTEAFPELPHIRTAFETLSWREDVARQLGVTGIPLYLGGSDGVLANLGSGLFDPSEVALTVGTSGAVRATHQNATVDPKYGLFNYRMFGDYFVVGGPTNNGGKVLAYWQELLAVHLKDVGAFIDAACSVSREDCPVFVPYLYGERAPVWDASATAELTGLRGHHDHRHLARAVLEGVTDNLVVMLRQLEEVVGPARRVHASGGFTRSPEWLDLLAEKSAREVVVADAAQATAYGAALIARGPSRSLLGRVEPHPAPAPAPSKK